MTHLPILAPYAAVLGILYLLLSIRVIRQRGSSKVSLGHGKSDGLLRAARAHGNFAEYVPFALLLIWLTELAGFSHSLVSTLCLLLVAGRVMHVYGILIAEKSDNMRYRIGGMMLTFTVLGLSALLLLFHTVQH